MAVNLTKGQKISLVKEAGGELTQIKMGLGWDVGAAPQKSGGFLGGLFGGSGSAGGSIDLDASCIMLDANKQLVDAIWFGQLQSKDNSVQHTGDNRTGAGDGDDEVIKVDLSKVPADVSKVVFCAVIYDGQARNQNFGQVANAYIRIVNTQGGAEVARYDLSEDSSTETAMIFGELYKNNGEWKFRAVGQGFAGGLGPLAASYGVAV